MSRPAARQPQPHPPAPLPEEDSTGGASGTHLTTDHPAVRAIIGVMTAVAVLGVAVANATDPVVAALLSMVVLLYGVLSAIDTAEQRLPNRITLPLAGAVVVAVVIDGIARSEVGSAIGAIGVGLAFAAALAVLQFGMGDAKLAVTVGAIAGWLGGDAVAVTVYAGALSGAAAAVVLIVVHRRRDVSFAFGPCLAVGSVVGMVVGG